MLTAKVNRLVTTVSNLCCNICSMTFSTWLIDELNKRRLSRAELARRMGMSSTTITYVINGKRNPGPDLCQAIAKAFGLPPELVYRQAGLLPNNAAESHEFEELKYWFDQMSVDEQESFLAQGRAIIEIKKNRPKGKRQQPDPAIG